MSTDFFADLERQLVDAARDRPRRLRRARARRVAVALAAIALLCAGATGLVATLVGTRGDAQAPAGPRPHDPVAPPAALRHIRVAVLDATSGPGTDVAARLRDRGVRVTTVGTAPGPHPLPPAPQAITQVFFTKGHQPAATQIGILLRDARNGRYPPVSPLPSPLRAAAGPGADVVVLAGSAAPPSGPPQAEAPPPAAAILPPALIRVAVLNATTAPGLARGVANRLQDTGFKIGNVTNAADQSATATYVAYAPGRRREAQRVATAIGLRADALRPLTAGQRAVAGPDAIVAVLVGSDQNAARGR
jgi:hypothetical protein